MGKSGIEKLVNSKKRLNWSIYKYVNHTITKFGINVEGGVALALGMLNIGGADNKGRQHTTT